MKKLKIKIKNCYGIRSMTATLHFESGNNVAIYASNGTMKSSLAHVFKDARDGNDDERRDRIFTDELSSHKILRDGEPVPREAILVLDPSDALDEVQTSAGILVNRELREEYGGIMAEMKDGIDSLVRHLNKLSGVTKAGIPDAIFKDFGKAGQPADKLHEFLLDHASHDPSELERFGAIRYADMFNGDTQRLFDTPGFQKLLAAYLDRRDRLVASSRFLSERFDHHAAGDIQRSLKKAGFFEASHMVVMNAKPGRDDAAEEIRSAEELEAVVKAELDAIESDLDSDWDKMDAMMAQTAKLSGLRLLLSENRWLIPHMADLSSLRRTLWESYFAAEAAAIGGICERYRRGRPRLDRIVEAAASERTKWESIVGEFSRRFRVPFEVRVTNQAEALLGIRVPSLEFAYRDEARRKTVVRERLKTVLSDGERRALYILNMLFEVQRQIDAGRETVS